MASHERPVIGTQPWLPGPLGRSSWWTTPIAAERLAALRIGIAGVLLLDLSTTFWPRYEDFFGPGGLGAPGWSPLSHVGSPLILQLPLWLWVAAAAGLTLGLFTRSCALLCWALTLSFQRLNPAVHNAGDAVRIIALFLLIFCPCGAAWSLDAWLFHRKRGLVSVPPWPVRLLFIQMTIIYFLNGLTKCFGPDWQAGGAMHYVLSDVGLMRWSPAWMPWPQWLIKAMTWGSMAWEVTFPIMVLRPFPRFIALGIGVLFHITTLVLMDLGAFPLNMLCLYLPLLPWERVARRR
jgi:hypothetical protein